MFFEDGWWRYAAKTMKNDFTQAGFIKPARVCAADHPLPVCSVYPLVEVFNQSLAENAPTAQLVNGWLTSYHTLVREGNSTYIQAETKYHTIAKVNNREVFNYFPTELCIVNIHFAIRLLIGIPIGYAKLGFKVDCNVAATALTLPRGEFPAGHRPWGRSSQAF